MVVHTLANEGGELGAWLPASKAPAPMTDMHMHMPGRCAVHLNISQLKAQ